MSSGAPEDTFDWDAYWTDISDEKCEEASPSAHHAADVLCEFVDRFDAPSGVADVGCGAGVTTFAAADRLAEPVVGYDTATPVVERNRDRAARHGLDA